MSCQVYIFLFSHRNIILESGCIECNLHSVCVVNIWLCWKYDAEKCLVFSQRISFLLFVICMYYKRMFSGWITLDYIHNVNMNKCLESDEWYDWIHSWGRHRSKRLKQDWQTEYSENKNCKEKYFWWNRFMWGGGAVQMCMLMLRLVPCNSQSWIIEWYAERILQDSNDLLFSSHNMVHYIFRIQTKICKQDPEKKSVLILICQKYYLKNQILKTLLTIHN